MIFNSVFSKNMNIWNDTNNACEKNFKIYYMVTLKIYENCYLLILKHEFMLSQNSFSAKEGLTRRETHWAMAPMFFACFPDVLEVRHTKTGDLVKENVGVHY